MDSSKIIFFNTGWMSRYEGDKNKPDKIVGGGAYVDQNGTGHEVCNFVIAKDGNVYGHVETIRGQTDRKIQAIDKIGGKDKSHSNDVTVVWTATHPENGGGYVVGWYQNATVFRERTFHGNTPSKQHTRDNIKSYIARTKAEDSFCLPIAMRTLILPKSVRTGQTPWRVFPRDANKEQKETLSELTKLINGTTAKTLASHKDGRSKHGNRPARTAYQRYVEAYEVTINPEHNILQSQFCQYLKLHCTAVEEDINYVDVRYRNEKGWAVLAEVKPCTRETARFAIRAAIGQLLDYKQRQSGKVRLLIVTQVKPVKEDRRLAKDNGFGLAYPNDHGSFTTKWPQKF